MYNSPSRQHTSEGSPSPPSPAESLLWSKDALDFLRDSQSTIQYFHTPPTSPPLRPADTSIDLDPIADANKVLSFIALLDSASATNETGWTHANATRALVAKRRRARSSLKDEADDFDFFSHFDPKLRGHLRQAYERRKRDGYSGDAPPVGFEDSMSLLMQERISAAAGTPARKSPGQLARLKRMVDTERENGDLDGLEGMFGATMLGKTSGESDDEEKKVA